MEVKSAQAAAFLANPDPAIRTILLFGPDSGLVSERAAGLVTKFAGKVDDPFAVVTFESDALAADPPKLAESAHAVSLFGGRRVIRIRAGGARSFLPALEAVLSTPPEDSMIVIEAGDLRKTAPLRKRCETARSAAAIGCYAEVDLDKVIDEEIRGHGLTIAQDARQALRISVGADRMQSRSEIRKLCLYVGSGEVTIEDVRAVVADAGDSEMGDLIDAAALGDTAALDRAWRRLVASGTSGAAIIAAAQRHFQGLHRARAVTDGGGMIGDALGRMQMGFGGPRRSAMERQIRQWSAPLLERALARIDRALLDSRLNANLGHAIVAETLLAIAAGAARMSRH